MTTAINKGRRWMPGLSALIFIGIGLGVVTGLFFGEMVNFLDVVGEVWIKLLQMTVLPYVMLSLISGLGHLTYYQALLIARTTGFILVLLWLVTLFVVFLFPYTFPDWESASFFSTNLSESKAEVDFLNLYIPSNLFHSLANNLVPAVVLFSIAIGVALIGVKKKDVALEGIEIMLDALTRITNFVVMLTPLGVFAIIASAAGTLSFGDFQRLEVYVYAYIALSLVMSLWILPGLVTALTPVTYHDMLGKTKDALVTAFATGSLFVVLPMLIENSKSIMQRYCDDQDASNSAIEVIVPASFNFPHAGKLFALSFILFSGWYSGFDLDISDYPLLASMGLVSLFASVNIAVPFLLDMFRVPADMFELFVTTGVINARFATLLSAMFTLTLTLLGAFSMMGQVTFQLKAILKYLLVSALLLIVTVLGVKFLLTMTIENTYEKDEIVNSMKLLPNNVKKTVYLQMPVSSAAQEEKGTRLQSIVDRGILRACYRADAVPFSYLNTQGDLVGLDVELLHKLAYDLGTSIEFIPSTQKAINQYLNNGDCDIGTGVAMTPQGALEGDFSTPIMYRKFAFLVRDYDRKKFSSLESMLAMRAPVIAILPLPYYIDLLHRAWPQAKVVEVESYKEFIASQGYQIDAFLTTAEEAVSISLLYPQYTIAFPKSRKVTIPAAFPLPRDEERWADYIKVWLELKRNDATIDALYNYWVMGKQQIDQKPRWSVIRDVLHWVD